MVIGIKRKELFNKLKKQGFDFINVIHPFTSISKTASLGEGITIYVGTVINTQAKIEDMILALNSSIGHHTLIKYSLISASASIGANVVIGEEFLLQWVEGLHQVLTGKKCNCRRWCSRS